MLRKNRIVSALLTLVLALSAIVMPASAEEITYTDAYMVKTYDNLPEFEDVLPALTYGDAIMAKLNGKYGMYDIEANKWLVEPKFDGIHEIAGITDGITYVSNAEGKWCVYDIENNRQLTEYLYSEIYPQGLKTAIAKKPNSIALYLVSHNGSEVLVSDHRYIDPWMYIDSRINFDQRLLQIIYRDEETEILGTYHVDEAGNITPYTGTFTAQQIPTTQSDSTYFGYDWHVKLLYAEDPSTGVKHYLPGEISNVMTVADGILVCEKPDTYARYIAGRIVRSITPGTPMGDVLYTDIVAYIDDKPIRSYNIAGNTYIVVEDLAAYGFDVQWIAEGSGKLVVGTTRTATPDGYTTTYVPEKNTKPAGSVAMQYLYTNITAWLGDKQVTGYNIGGYTCIGMDDLAGTFAANYVWDGVNGALKLYTQP